MNITVYVLTSSKYQWAIRPFSYLFNTFWSELQPVIVVTDTIPKFKLPGNFSVMLLNEGNPLPKEKWSDGVMAMLNAMEDELFVWMLEDYWLIRHVDNGGVNTLAEYMSIHKDVLRMDLTDDRQYAGDRFDIGTWGHYDIVETPSDSPYQFSTQAALWRKELLLDLMRPGLSPWDAELFLSPELHEKKGMRCLGTRQRPIRYANVFYQEGLADEQLKLIPKDQMDFIRKQKWLKR